MLEELAGAAGLTAQASTFTRRDVVDQLARRLPPGASAEGMLRQLETLADRFLTERAVVVARDEQLAEERYSTPELLAIEQRMLDGATARVDAGAAVVAPEHLRATLEAFPSMAQDQADALADLTGSGAGVSLLVGKADYGKTYVAGAVAHAYGLQGHRVIGTAPTGLAATGLGNEGYGERSARQSFPRYPTPGGRRMGTSGWLLRWAATVPSSWPRTRAGRWTCGPCRPGSFGPSGTAWTRR